MKKFRVVIEGDNFVLSMDGKVGRYGFFKYEIRDALNLLTY
jgi:hypothetical protein